MTEQPHECVFFAHIQKTAGTTLIARLRNTFGRSAVYPLPEDKGDVAAILSVDHLLRRWRERRDTLRVVAGHFPLCTAELLGNLRAMTILREPVERTLSYLRHHRQLTPEDAEKPLEAIYEDPFRYHGMIHNQMVKMLSLRNDEMTAGMLTHVEFTRDHLARAIENLERVAVIGIQDRFDDFCTELARTFGWFLDGPKFTNRTAPVDVSDDFLSRIAQDNALDLELYAYARDLIDSRSAA